MLYDTAIGENAILDMAMGGEHHIDMFATEAVGGCPEVRAEEGSRIRVLFSVVSYADMALRELNCLPRPEYSR